VKEMNIKNQDERLDYLVEELCKGSIEYKDMKVNKADRRIVMRSLMNIRMPKPISKEFLKVQDEFLKEETIEKGIVNINDIPTIREEYNSNIDYADKISIWQGDITRLAVDGIVNAANSQMLGCFVPCHKCIDNAIHFSAGIELRQECYEYMQGKRKKGLDYEEPTGSAVVTSAYNLPCKYVIHTVGPIVYNELTDKLRDDLRNCYLSCLKSAVKNGIHSIAFCCISTGEFHFPNEEAAKIALSTVNEFLKTHEEYIDRIIFNVFKDYDLEIYRKLIFLVPS
jgi:O-acetyl-ADP-ribose deacetylase (regulator of RNase III)